MVSLKSYMDTIRICSTDKDKKMKIFQKGFNYSQDGDGNRLVYHLQGCNMNCPWCANPEGLAKDGVIVADEEWILESICPHGAIQKTEVDRAKCEICTEKDCITKHDTKGMYLSCKDVSVQEIEEEILANEMMFYDGGGVTFTGGEATLQFEELKEVLQFAKENGIHTAIETNGSHKRLAELFPLVDQLIMDCKLANAKKHRDYTGIDGEIILSQIERAAKEHHNLHVRVPLIGEVNNSEQDLNEFIAFFEKIKGENVTFEILLYHEFGKKKWKQCGMEYQMTDRAYVDPKVREDFKQRILGIGAKYKHT